MNKGLNKVLMAGIGTVLLILGIAYAREVITQDLKSSAGNTTITVNGTSVYTKAFVLDDSEYNAISYYAYSPAADIDVTLELQQSWVMPVTEGAADGNYTESVAMSDIVTNLTTESTWYNKALSAPAMKYGRIKITEAVTADTQVTLKLHKRIN